MRRAVNSHCQGAACGMLQYILSGSLSGKLLLPTTLGHWWLRKSHVQYLSQKLAVMKALATFCLSLYNHT